MSYDPEARRDTPLALKLNERIKREGPIPVSQYMIDCLLDTDHGFYTSSTAIGRDGHFVTAPEISQVFGELVGLWTAVVWQQIGSPAPFSLIELGPGRGTMMRDMLRATRIVPGFHAACRVELVEASDTLREVQRRTLSDAGVPIDWILHDSEVDGPAIVVSNEFLDTIQVWQDVKVRDGWAQRVVALNEHGQLTFALGQAVPHPGGFGQPELPRDTPDGTILEWQPHDAIWLNLGKRSRTHPVAALFIDYGHTTSAVGETLQAVRNHAFEHPLTSPGEADLSVQVDFERVAISARHHGLAVDGPTTQAEFLGRLGIVERASRLMSANPAKAASIEAGVARLLAVPGMGDRFKVIGMRSPQLPPLPGF